MTTVKSRGEVSKMNSAPAVFVRFKSDGCGHCVDSQPMWDDMIRQLSGYAVQPGCIIREVESAFSDAFKALGSDGTAFQIRGVPAYEFFRNGKQLALAPIGRDAGSLLAALQTQNFIKKKASAPIASRGRIRGLRRSRVRKNKRRRSSFRTF